MSPKSFIIFLLFLLILGAGAYFYLKTTYPTILPATTASYYLESIIKPHANLTANVIGFLPYWQEPQLANIRPQLLSEINFFSLSVGEDGHILKVNNYETDPGWRVWQSDNYKKLQIKAHILGAHNTVTIAALNSDLIDSILASSQAQQNLIADIATEVKTRHLDGVTIDFEYLANPSKANQANFTQMSKDLKTTLTKINPDIKISLTLMPLAARTPGLFDLSSLRPIYDYFIGMSYEYYGVNADISGPTAPMQGFAQKKYFYDVTSTYTDFLQVIPRDKLVMGVPYYGWERAVKDGKTPGSRTFPASSPNNYAGIVSFARGKENTDFTKSQCSWEPIAEETWCWYKDKTTGIDRQLWLADTKSIGTRYDYAIKKQFAGVALWTLGYDKAYPDLWDLIKTKFTN